MLNISHKAELYRMLRYDSTFRINKKIEVNTLREKSWRRITFFVVIMMFFTMMGTSVRAAAIVQDKELKYVSLGDSVAYGLSAPSQKGYAKMFASYLNAVKKPGTTVRFSDLGVPGYTTSDLLAKLSGDDVTRNALDGADIVTINIGSNNLLSFMVGAALASYGYTGSLETLNYDVMLQNMRDMLKLAKYDMNMMMAPYKALAVNEQLAAYLAGGVLLFKGQWTFIIQKIKELAPNAKIIVNRLYKPLANDDPLYQFIKTYIQEINGEIDLKATLGYKVADVYNAIRQYDSTRLAVPFSMRNAILAAMLNNKSLFMLSLDPHPTLLGHTLIFKQILNKYR